MAADRPWNVPNLLTASRLAIAPFAVREILQRHPRNALVLILIAAATDLLDGLTARATGAQTAVGRLFDPLADKVLLSGVFLGLAWIGSVPVWLVVVIFSRDALLILLSIYALLFTTYSDLQPNLLGKGSTVLQIATAGYLLARDATGRTGNPLAEDALIWSTALLTVLSGTVYLARYFQRLIGTGKPRKVPGPGSNR